MKRSLLIILVIVFAVSMSLFSFACKTPTTGAEETTAAAAEKNPADFEIVYIVKADGIPWFDVSRAGLDQCAKDYGFKASTVGPPKADAALQAQMVEDYIAKGVDAIGVCPNDPASIEPVFEKANKAGILTFGHEGSTFKNVSYDIEAMNNQTFGESIMTKGIEVTGGKGGYVASVGFLTSVSHNEWVDAEIAYQQANAADFKNQLGYEKGSDRFEEGEDQNVAHDKILEFLKTYPDLTLVIGSPMTTGPAAGLAIEEKGLKGKLMFVGTGLPITIGKYLKSDTVQAGFFWDPWRVGYALGYVALNTWLGNPPKDGDPVLMPGDKALEGYDKIGIITNSNGGKVIFGQGQIMIDKANVDDWYKQFADYGWPQE
ncbi:MAG: substrate-binding domain-containing protein [Actinobacteria bacterium]|nr:substrate-binding domain-containing protein [Actinomycetota bacterium]